MSSIGILLKDIENVWDTFQGKPVFPPPRPGVLWLNLVANGFEVFSPQPLLPGRVYREFSRHL
jgi:hypothetical protein